MDKRIIPVTAFLIFSFVSGFFLNQLPLPVTKLEGKVMVVASFYPLAYLAEVIGGEHVYVQSLIQPGSDAHTWQPTTEQLMAASNADLIVFNGASLDGWIIDDLLPAVDVEGKVLVDTTDGVQLIENTERAEVREHGQYDPHTWVCPYTAMQQAGNIYEALVEIDPINMDYYSARWTALKIRLMELDVEYNSSLADRKRNVIFVTHEAFGYLALRYGFEQHGVVGLIEDQQPSTQTIISIVNEMENTEVYAFYLEPGYSGIYVEMINNELSSRTGRQVRVLELYHMVGQISGLDFIQQMEKNLENLREGLES